jgi:hypothetical protein
MDWKSGTVIGILAVDRQESGSLRTRPGLAVASRGDDSPHGVQVRVC